MKTYYIRKKSGKKFAYYLGTTKEIDQKIIDRINKLAIPPAWKNVQIAVKPSEKVQATGRDKAGRVQSIYNPVFRAEQEQKKFNRILEFGKQLPGLREQVSKDIAKQSLTKEKVLATIVSLMDEAYFRVGNENYAKANQSYGITTLRRKHTNIKTTTVTFDFIGKSGKRHHKVIKSRRIAGIMKQLDELPGHEVFQYIDANKVKHSINSNDVNQYIKQHMGTDFTAKDFRTWGGTMVAAAALAIEKGHVKESDKKKAINRCVKQVAKQLGNTPTIARASYIDPRIIETYLNTDVLEGFSRTIAHMKPEKYLKSEEKATLAILKNYGK